MIAAFAALSKGVEIIQAASEAIDFANRALEAAQNGDEAKAAEYLAASRKRYADARAAWDAAEEAPSA